MSDIARWRRSGCLKVFCLGLEVSRDPSPRAPRTDDRRRIPMSSHPEYAYADPAHPFHDFPSPPATAVDLDAITLDEFSRRRAARARLLNPELADLTMPE